MSVASKRFLVQGRVQGVGFRYFVVETARRLALSGYVRNLPDGSVEAVARGEELQLEALETHLRRGPAAARVDSVRSEVYSGTLDSDGFRFRR